MTQLSGKSARNNDIPTAQTSLPIRRRSENQAARVQKAAPEPVWPADKVERWPVDRLVPYARNARTHTAAQIDQIAASIREWGWTNPALVDENGTIIAGHGRVLAAQKLGLAQVPVMVATGWSEAQRRAYLIADNKLAQNAGWDETILGLELADLQGLGFDLELIGFSGAELSGLLATSDGLTDPDDIPAPPMEPISRTGDLWLLGGHRLICGDSTMSSDVQRVLGDVRPHLMVTDPPYGVAYDPGWRGRTTRMGKVLNDDRADWREAWALFQGDVAYVWHASLFVHEVADSLIAADFDLRAHIIWAKDRLQLSRGHYHWQHEPCWYAVRRSGSGHWTGDRKQTTLWQIPNRHQDAKTQHSTQKPVECMKRPIENNSSPGQAVYEPFSGSGTTIIAAEMTGRACHAIELSPVYVDVAVLRWQNFTGADAVLEGDGRTFAAVRAEREAAG